MQTEIVGAGIDSRQRELEQEKIGDRESWSRNR
jgi:hypothetical protein